MSPCIRALGRAAVPEHRVLTWMAEGNIWVNVGGCTCKKLPADRRLALSPTYMINAEHVLSNNIFPPLYFEATYGRLGSKKRPCGAVVGGPNAQPSPFVLPLPLARPRGSGRAPLSRHF